MLALHNGDGLLDFVCTYHSASKYLHREGSSPELIPLLCRVNLVSLPLQQAFLNLHVKANGFGRLLVSHRLDANADVAHDTGIYWPCLEFVAVEYLTVARLLLILLILQLMVPKIIVFPGNWANAVVPRPAFGSNHLLTSSYQQPLVPLAVTD